MCKEDVVLNSLQWLIGHKTKPNQLGESISIQHDSITNFIPVGNGSSEDRQLKTLSREFLLFLL